MQRWPVYRSVCSGQVWPFTSPLWPRAGFIVAYLVLESFFSAIFIVSLFAVFMAISWPPVAATQFTAYMALQNLSTTTGAALAAPLEKFGGIRGVYLTVAVIQILIVGLDFTIDTRETRRVLGEGETSV